METLTYSRPPASPPPLPGSGRRASAPVSPEEIDQLSIEHLPLVRVVARKIHERLPQHVEFEELVSAGVLGLVDAAAKFDPRKNVQFRTYAQFRVRGAILDSLRDLDWSSRDLRRRGREIEEAIQSLTAKQRRAPSEQEIAEALSLSLAEYQSLLGDLKGLEIGTLHTEHHEGSDDEEIAYLPGAPEDDPLFQCMRSEMRARIADAIEALPERERLVLTLYYYEDLSMKEIGLVMGVVESRVSQIRSSAILHLRAKLLDYATPSHGAEEMKPGRAR